MTVTLDPRRTAARPDLADIRLDGRVAAERFVETRPMSAVLPVVEVYRRPDAGAPVDTQLLFGEAVRVLETRDGWSWLQAEADGYVGYVRAETLGEPVEATHRVTALTTFVYPEPELRTVPLFTLSMGSRLRLTGETETRGLSYSALAGGGFIVTGHTAPVDAHVPDYVAVAETFLHVPYRWAGRSAFGIDCSGLVQLAMAMTGRSAPRDSDMQQAEIGTELADDAPLQRGDLVFWSGHVGIMLDAEMLLHSNGKTMDTSVEPLAGAIARIEPLYGRPTGRRRP
ncbi:MAG: C40 family peptidase [Rhodobiaceae bacterium]|nr:C40 family peptidase [Rhodobiaceae bacterium]